MRNPRYNGKRKRFQVCACKHRTDTVTDGFKSDSGGEMQP